MFPFMNSQTPNPIMLGPTNQMLLGLFYQFRKQFPADIQYVQILKGDFDHDTGKLTNSEKIYTIAAVLQPIEASLTILKKLEGKVEKLSSVFLFKVSDLPGVEISTEDFIIYKNKRYKVLTYEKQADVLVSVGVEGFK
jgi:hypothetical protein